MLREVAQEDVEHAKHVLADAGVPHSVTLAEGPSVREIVEAFAAKGDRRLAPTLRRTRRIGRSSSR